MPEEPLPRLEKADRFYRLVLDEELDIEAIDLYNTQIKPMVEKGEMKILVINFKNIKHLDSFDLSTLIGFIKTFQANQASLYFIDVRGFTKELFLQVSMHKMTSIIADESEIKLD